MSSSSPRASSCSRRVLADRLELTEPGLALDAVPLPDEALVDERRERLERFAERHPLAGHRVRELERAPAGEDAEAGEERLLGRLEQVVAPLDRVPQRALALGQVAGAAGQQVEPLLEPAQDRLRVEQLHARGRQLDRQRQTVEPAADRGDGLLVLGRELEAGLDRLRTIEEELHRGNVGERHVPARQIERRDRKLVLLAKMQRRLARHEHLHRGRRGQNLVDERGRGQHLLEVVEHEQRRRVCEPPRDRLRDRLLRATPARRARG